MMDQTLQQQRAAFALRQVAAIKGSGDGASRFRAYSNSLPAMIQANGIGQAMAFAYQKAQAGKGPESEGWGHLYKSVSQWLCEHRRLWDGGDDLMNALMSGSQHQYQLAQAETQALLRWVKDFARAELGNQED